MSADQSNSNQKKFDNPLSATLKGIGELFKKQEPVGELNENDRIDGKRVLITGSSSGLGLATAKALAARGGEIIMAVRSGIPEKGEQVKQASKNDRVHMLWVDLSDFESISNLVQQVSDQFGTIDILICNAAMVALKGRKTDLGMDEMFTVNYLSNFVLVNLLLKNKILRSNERRIPRLIFVSSENHRNPNSFQWESFGKFIPFSAGKTVERYGYHKLLLTTFSKELSRRLNPNGKTKVSVFAHCPGPVNSNIAREAPTLFQPLLKLTFSLFFRSPQKASEPLQYLAVSQDQEGKPYDYLFLMSRKNVSELASNAENGNKLWQVTEELLTQLKVNY